MQAFEFVTKPENGTITLPAELQPILKSSIRVLILQAPPTMEEEEGLIASRKSDLLLSPTLDTRGWKFNREEANER